jgi:hypothetical protein
MKADKLILVAAIAAGALWAAPSAAQAQAPNRPNVTYFRQPMTYPSHNGQYGNVTFYAQPYTAPGHNGQYGGVTYFAQPYTAPSHNGQYGGVTYFVQPYSYPGTSGQSGNVTYFGVQPRGTVAQPVVPVPVRPVPNLVPARPRP